MAATIIGVGLGLVVGLTAAYSGGIVDEVLMRVSDVFMAFPQIVLALLLVTAFGPSVLPDHPDRRHLARARAWRG